MMRVREMTINEPKTTFLVFLTSSIVILLWFWICSVCNTESSSRNMTRVTLKLLQYTEVVWRQTANSRSRTHKSIIWFVCILSDKRILFSLEKQTILNITNIARYINFRSFWFDLHGSWLLLTPLDVSSKFPFILSSIDSPSSSREWCSLHSTMNIWHMRRTIFRASREYVDDEGSSLIKQIQDKREESLEVGFEALESWVFSYNF